MKPEDTAIAVRWGKRLAAQHREMERDTKRLRRLLAELVTPEEAAKIRAGIGKAACARLGLGLLRRKEDR